MLLPDCHPDGWLDSPELAHFVDESFVAATFATIDANADAAAMLWMKRASLNHVDGMPIL